MLPLIQTGGGSSGSGGGVTSFTGDIVVYNNSGSTGAVTLSLIAQIANKVFAGPSSGGNAAPTFRSLVGADLPNPSSSTLGGIQSLAAVSHNWINAISTLGVPSATQPAFTDISGSVAATQLPNPSASTLGGIQSLAAVGSRWINAISTLGVPSATQPAASDLSNGVQGSGAVVLASAPTLTNPVVGTQAAGDNSTKAASTAYVDGKLLSFQYSVSGLTGNSAEQTLLTYTLPGGTLLAGRGIRVTLRWLQTGATSTSYKFYFGTAVQTTTSTNSAQQFPQAEFVIFNQPGVTNAQAVLSGFRIDGNALVNTGMTDPAVDTTTNQVIKFTFNVANTVAVSKIAMSVELI